MENWVDIEEYNLSRNSKSEDLREIIIENIRNGKLSPGDKLPSLREIASTFQISIPTLREALKSLEAQNIVSIKHGKGVFISDNPGRKPELFGFDLILSEDPLKMCLESRLAFEPKAAYYAAQRATDKDIKEIKNALVKMEQLVKENKRHTSAELEFHSSICRASHNPFLVRIQEAVTNYYEKVAKKHGYSKKIPKAVEKALEDHLSIFKAIETKSSKNAQKLMENHLGETLKAYSKII